MSNLSWMGALVVYAGLAAGCASTGRSGPEAMEAVGPDRPFVFEDREFRILTVQDDFVVLENVKPENNPGEITGWVKEVFRVSRYDLGEGRWFMYEGLPGAYLQWCGGDQFRLARDRNDLEGAEVALLR